MQRRGCESEAVANVITQMRVRNTDSVGIRSGQAELQLVLYCLPSSLVLYKEKLQYPQLLLDKFTTDREQTVAEVILMESIKQ